MVDFYKSDAGAQAAWKGFSSQTLYIASRLISDEGGYEYYPEDIEDLVVKKNGAVVEAVQVKNISADLTLSSLAATKTSKGKIFHAQIHCAVEGSPQKDFSIACCSNKNMHIACVNPFFHRIKVVYFILLVLNCRKCNLGKLSPKRL